MGCQFTLVPEFFLEFLFTFFVIVQTSQSDHCKIDHPKMPKIARTDSVDGALSGPAPGAALRPAGQGVGAPGGAGVNTLGG